LELLILAEEELKSLKEREKYLEEELENLLNKINKSNDYKFHHGEICNQ